MNLSSSLNIATESKATSSPGSIQVLAAGGRIKLSEKVVQVSGVRGETGRGVRFDVLNVGAGYLRFGSDMFTITGPDASQFAIVAGRPRDIPPGKRATFTVALRAAANADVNRVLTASVSIKQSNRSDASASLALRGLATTGEGADKEPSLARLLELFQYGIDVGDATPETTFLDLDGSPTDQVTAPRFEKAENGYVTIEPIAQFVNKTASVAGRVGTYEPGTPDSRKELFSLAGPEGQMVNPSPNGSTAFDPGNRAFGLYAEAPLFIDGILPRQVYTEDALNTWEPDASKRGKVRTYPLREGGETVANAYVVTFEEFSAQNDQNDVVFVIRNVRPLKSTPEIGLIAIDGQPDPDRLAFSRIQNENATFGNGVHDISTVRVVNTGNRDLTISSISIDEAARDDFQLVNAPTTPRTLRRGATLDVTVRFVADGGDLRRGTLSIVSNDRDEPTKRVALGGFWQSFSEMDPQGNSQEPSLQEIVDTFGFRTQVEYDGQEIDGNGRTEAIGDEVLADAWAAADPAKPVSVQEIAGFHAANTTNQVGWYKTGSPFYGSSDPRNPGATNGPRNALFDTNADDAQTFFQRKNFSNDYAQASFLPGTDTFGLRVDGEFSDDALNTQVSGDEGGHHWRFYPARDENNNFIADAWIVTMDFSSINFDYNDHIFLVRNMRPADRPAAVTGLTGTATTAGNAFDWADVPGATGYAVLRANSSGGPYARISPDVLGDSAFNDRKAPAERTRYYRIVAIGENGEFGVPANLGVTRPA